MLNIDMNDSIQNNFAEIWVLTYLSYMEIPMVKKQTFHNTTFFYIFIKQVFVMICFGW